MHLQMPNEKETVMTERPAEPAVGQRLRDLRQRRGLTQRRLAQACDLSANAIGLIERGESSPSVSTLHRLALALEVPIAELFTESETQTVVLTKKSQRLQAHRGQIQMENLAEGLSDQCMEPYLVTLQPGAGTGADPVVHLGEEFVFCLEGEVEYRVADHAYQLEAGDSLMFQASQPHCGCNLSAEPARLLLVFHAAEESSKWWQQHLNQQT
jgi:transcriptional regulator with XRE-family HTH domain